MNVAVVTYADTLPRYIASQQRQEQSLKDVAFDGDYFHFHSPSELQCPPHMEVPYAFKPYAMAQVAAMDYDVIIWMDSVVHAVKPLTALVSHIVTYGHAFFDNTQWAIGDYTSDECLKYFALSRDEAFRAPMIMACVMGLDMRHGTSKLFFQQYLQAAKDKVAYQGAWTYQRVVSEYYGKQILGHRHDQSAASCIIHKMGLSLLTGPETFFAYGTYADTHKISENVCLVSR